jgi:imidazole glycerol-phosphate synthase subunit HisF
MRRIRVIPALLVENGALVKTVRFRAGTYVGDPIVAVRIFNEKEVDELTVLDISAARQPREPDYGLIENLAAECFMPTAYGGGITRVDQVKRILRCGVEKVVLNSSTVRNPSLVTEAARFAGSQSVVVSIDVRTNWFGQPRVFVRGGKTNTGLDPADHAAEMERRGAGEILLTSISRDGSYKGYDIALIRRVVDRVSIPVVAAGGARQVEDFTMAVNQGGASAVAAGSMFVFKRKHRAVLINYPSPAELEAKLFNLA